MPKRKAMEDLRAYRYALAAREQLAIGRVADRFGVQSSTVSRRIRDLEDELGVSLFERHSAGVRPTDAGEDFFRRVRVALNALNVAVTQAGAAGRGEIGAIRVGYTWPISNSGAKRLWQLQRQRAPNVGISLFEKRTSDLVTSLLDRSIDVAFLDSPNVGGPLEQWKVWSEQLFFAVPEALNEPGTAAWKILEGRALLACAVDDWSGLQDLALEHLGALVEVRIQDCSREGLLGLVAAGAGVTVLPESATAISVPGIAFIPVEDVRARLSVWLTWSRENADGAVRRFVGLVKSTFGPLETG